MSAMKDLLIGYQEEVYAKLVALGADYCTIYTLEELFQKRPGYDFIDCVEKIAGYAIAIGFLSNTTGYTQERLWEIWKDMAADAVEEDPAELDEAWESFKMTTQEKDW